MFLGLYGCIAGFVDYLAVSTQVSLTTEMTEVFVKIVFEVLFILSTAIKEVKRKQPSESFLQDILCSLRRSYFVRTKLQKTVEKPRFSGCVGGVT